MENTLLLLLYTIPIIACEQPTITVELHDQTIEMIESYESEQYPTIVRPMKPDLPEESFLEESTLTAKQKYALIAAAITTGGSLITAVVTYLLTYYLAHESE